MTEAFLSSCFVAGFLIVWFRTNVVVEYLFFLPILSNYIKEYQKASKLQSQGMFINFLSLNYDNFFIRLVSCPFCITGWISLISLFFLNIKFLGLIYILSLLLYKIIVYLYLEKL